MTVSCSISRRGALLGSLATGAEALLSSRRASADVESKTVSELAAIEARYGGRLGVAILDTATMATVSHRGDERFPMCSTFKVLAVAAVLAQVDRGRERLDRPILYTEKELVTYSPATKDHVGPPGMRLDAICEAAITLSDNTAGNLLLGLIGGPAGWTEFARSLGDQTSRLDRVETELNEATPGDPRDTTSPRAMLGNLQRILLGDVLTQASKDRLTAWLIANKTGDKRLRAGLPKNWKVGDKTGSGDHGVANDVAVIWPPGRAPVLVAAYFAESPKSELRDAALAEVGGIIANR